MEPVNCVGLCFPSHQGENHTDFVLGRAEFADVTVGQNAKKFIKLVFVAKHSNQTPPKLKLKNTVLERVLQNITTKTGQTTQTIKMLAGKRARLAMRHIIHITPQDDTVEHYVQPVSKGAKRWETKDVGMTPN